MNVDRSMFKHYLSQPTEAWFPTLDSLHAEAVRRRGISRAGTLPVSKMRFESVGDGLGIVLKDGGAPVAPTHWAFNQVCARLGANARYLRKKPSGLAAECLNDDIRHADSDKLGMLLRNDGGYMIHAVTGPDYGRIWNDQVSALAMRLNEAAGGHLKNPPCWDGRPGGLWLNDRQIVLMFIDGGSIVDGGAERDQIYRGYYMWNSEVADSTFGIDLFYFRYVCGNLQIYGKKSALKVKIRHTKYGPDRAMQVSPLLRSFLDSDTSEEVDLIRRAKAKELPAQNQKLLEHVTSLGFTTPRAKEAIEVARAEEGDCRNYWDLYQGFTSVAKLASYAQDRISLTQEASDRILARC